MKCRYVNRCYGFWCYALFFMMFFFGLATGCSVKNVVSPAAGVVTVAVPIIPLENKEGVVWPDNDLQCRFQQYWTLRRAGETDGLFKYEAPHIQEMIILGQYKGFYGKARNDWRSIRVEKVSNITDNLIEVKFNMIKNTSEETRREIFFSDFWLFFSGQWVHVLKDPFLTGDGMGK